MVYIDVTEYKIKGSFLSMLFRLLFTALVISLSACGGGGSDSTSPSNPPIINQPPTNNPATADQIIANPESYSKIDVRKAFDEKIDADYKGKLESAVFDVEAIQQVYLQIFSDVEKDLLNSRIIYDVPLQLNSNINQTISCTNGGFATVSGRFSATETTDFEINYTNCGISFANEWIFNGREILSLSLNGDERDILAAYYDNLELTFEGITTRFFGYAQSNQLSDDNSQTLQISRNLLITVPADNLQIVEKASYSALDVFFPLSNENNYVGSLKFSEFGALEIDRSWGRVVGDPSFDITNFTAFNAVRLEGIEGQFVKFLLNDDGDSVFELGTYLGDFFQWREADFSNITLVNANIISIAPEPRKPYIVNTNVTTFDEIVVLQGDILDRDTAISDLDISYRWYINDELVEGFTTSILPSKLAVFGDTVSVSMVVSDRANFIESPTAQIQISDSDEMLISENLASPLTAGEQIEFSVFFQDPDRPDELSIAEQLVLGPESATIDQNGRVTWLPKIRNMIFPIQTFSFNFLKELTANDSNDNLVFDVDVRSDKSFPLVRSGSEAPKYEDSLWSGDFDGDGIYEILSTNSKNTVFTLKNNNSHYVQNWFYPFSLPTKGEVMQVLAVNTDDDIEEEIIVVTSKGVSVIENLNSIAVPLFTTNERVINRVAIADINKDGSLELAYLSSSLYEFKELLTVIKLDSPSTIIFETKVETTTDIEIGNVDNDPQLELVLNTGEIFDGLSWDIQWSDAASFASFDIELVDFNGDNVSNIVGVDIANEVIIYSAVTENQVTISNKVRACAISSVKLAHNNTESIVTGDCTNRAIKAYSLEENTLSQLWSVDTPLPFFNSLIISDTDDDDSLEMHWANGQFQTADIAGNNATINNSNVNVKFDFLFASGFASENGGTSAIFFAPDPIIGRDGSVIVKLEDNGHFSISEEISSNWDNSFHSVVFDYDNDGVSEILLPTTEVFSGSISIMNLSDMSKQWEYIGEQSETIGVVDVFDFNQDGFQDVLFSTGTTLKIIDARNDITLDEFSFQEVVTDFSLVTSSDKNHIAVATTGKLHLLSFSNGTLSETSVMDQSCFRIDFGNINNDDANELMCLSHSNDLTSTFHIYSTTTDKLITDISFSTPNKIEDFVINNSTIDNQTLFVIEELPDQISLFENGYRYRLSEITGKGLNIWSSDAVIGKPTHRGMKYRQTDSDEELLISTEDTMHWIKF